MGMHDPFYPVTVDGIKPTTILNRVWQIAELGFLAYLVINRAFYVVPSDESALGVTLIYAHPAWWTWPVIAFIFSVVCTLGSVILHWMCRWTVVFIYGSEDPAIIEEKYNRRAQEKEKKRHLIRARTVKYEEVKENEDFQLPEEFTNLTPTSMTTEDYLMRRKRY